MKSVWNALSDPSLHFMVVALILVGLAFAGSSSSKEPGAEAPLGYCRVCKVHYLPEKSCECPMTQRIANVFP